MATKNITVTPTTGTGTNQLTVAGTSGFTGREPFSKTFRASGTGTYSGVTSSNMLTVTQRGNVIMMLNNPSGSISVSGGSITITGESNLAKLQLSLSSGLTLGSATVNGVVLSSSQLSELSGGNGYTVAGDPGKDEKYSISVVVSAPANSGSQRTFSFTLGDPSESSNRDTVIITQSGTVTTNQIWFSNGSSSTPSSTDVSITLDADGNIVGGADPRINTSPSGVSWTIDY